MARRDTWKMSFKMIPEGIPFYLRHKMVVRIVFVLRKGLEEDEKDLVAEVALVTQTPLPMRWINVFVILHPLLILSIPVFAVLFPFTLSSVSSPLPFLVEMPASTSASTTGITMK